MQMDATVMPRKRHVPVAPDKERLTVTLPRELAQWVRDYWHARQYSRASDAVVALLEIAREQVEREEPPPPKGRGQQGSASDDVV
jgi:hypothetical protein